MQEVVVGILTRAKQRIATHEFWCQLHFAQNNQGEQVASDDPEACRWCAYGAVNRERHDSSQHDWLVALNLLKRAAKELYGKPCFMHVNDSQRLGFHAVHRVFDRAIELAKEAA